MLQLGTGHTWQSSAAIAAGFAESKAFSGHWSTEAERPLIIGLPFAPPAEGGSASRSAAGMCPPQPAALLWWRRDMDPDAWWHLLIMGAALGAVMTIE
jgi:hypothetical protein